MIQCDHAVKFWNAAANFFNLKLQRLHPVTWKKDLLDPEFIKDHAAIAISVMWAIWSNGNKYVLGNVVIQKISYDHARSIQEKYSNEQGECVHVPSYTEVEAFSNAVDVVERLHDPTDPSTEGTAPPRSAHVQLGDVP